MDSVRKVSQNILHPADCCYKAAPCPDYHGDARLVVRLRDYQTAYDRIASLEAERDKAVELLKTECLCYEFSAACSRCKQKHEFLRRIGGEVKNG